MSKAFIAPNTLKLTSDFSYGVESDGTASGSAVFECRYIDYRNSAIKTKLIHGNPITTLSDNVPESLFWLKIDSFSPEHQKGGITKIRVQLKGRAPAEESSGIEERSTSYSYRGSMGQDTILNNPNYLREVNYQQARDAISGLWFGNAEAFREDPADTTSVINVFQKSGGELIESLTDSDVIKWANKVIKGDRYYDKPMLEWSVNQTNEGGMTDADVNKFGSKVTTPPGSPPVPSWATDAWWRFEGLDETKDEDTSSFSRTYTLRYEPYDADLYEIPE